MNCAYCEAYVDDMNSEAVGQWLDTGEEVTWCGFECYAGWITRERLGPMGRV